MAQVQHLETASCDLELEAAMLMGLDDWRGQLPVIEERLLAAVQALLGPQVAQLARPPAKEPDGFLPSDDAPGLPVATFPSSIIAGSAPTDCAPAVGDVWNTYLKPRAVI